MAPLIYNKKAGFDYEIMKKLEAGIELFGFEVKSLRAGRASLDGAFVGVRGGEAFLMGASVSPYQVGNTPSDYDERRPRRLLLTKKEIEELAEIEGKKGLTVVPLSVYNKGRVIKLELAVARGKKQFDKRNVIQKRETDREMERTLKKSF